MFLKTMHFCNKGVVWANPPSLPPAPLPSSLPSPPHPTPVPLIICIDALMHRPSEYWQARLAGCMHLHADTLSVVGHVSHVGVEDLLQVVGHGLMGGVGQGLRIDTIYSIVIHCKLPSHQISLSVLSSCLRFSSLLFCNNFSYSSFWRQSQVWS